ncbi:DUF7507 domain-containing protein [Prescottella agglutinans]|uniref:Repeat protein (TIGR01451 family) n=1 Tax=Prescottella agglutinans TaxID=1644129 RepID=A0ABT6M993_9NOCA|nr:choice-of-anchor D domain-containing protein [Prescottella agglutinans]MDH6280876.1 putative repeat protein (TIGR01451 family) [Prescottella agglutinans]
MAITTSVVAPTATAAPGSPGVPQAPKALFHEDFENTGVTPVSLTDYTGSAPLNMTYTADQRWLRECNGTVLSANASDADQSHSSCAGAFSYKRVRQEAQAMGVHNGEADPTSNHALTAMTEGAGGAPNEIMFETQRPVPMPPTNGRFLTASIDAAAINCYVGPSGDPLLAFSLLDGATEVPLFDTPINSCTDAGGTDVTVDGSPVHVGTYVANRPVLFPGSDVGLRLRNANGASGGNDGSVDNIKIVDVTPQLDKAFSPTKIVEGATSTLTFTVTNTTDRLAKKGWSFTDALPAGVTVADPAKTTTTCTDTTINATAGGTSVDVSGGLSAGQDSCTVSVDVTSSKVGSYTNSADNITAKGIDLPGKSTLEVVPPAPGLTIVKASTTTEITKAGEKVPYTFEVTNTGNVTVSDLEVTDKQTAPAKDENLSPMQCPATSLAPNETMKCTADYTVTQADIDNGSIKDVAKATGKSPKGDPVESPESKKEIGTNGLTPGLTIVKSSTATEFTKVGEKVPYTFEVTNTGAVTVSDLEVTDKQIAPAKDENLSPMQCPATSLAPNEKTTCTADYTVTQADIDNGSIKDVAKATGKSPKGDPVESPESEKEIGSVKLDPKLAVVKASTATEITKVGQKVPYTFEVTNTGNVTVSDVKVTDKQAAPAKDENLSAMQCPASTTLAPGESMTCTAEYTVAQADLDNGKVKDTAKATGKSPKGDPVESPESKKEIPTSGLTPDLTIVKSSTATELPKAGEKVPYKFTVTNTGNVTMTNVKVNDKQQAPSKDENLSKLVCTDVENGAITLAPGESISCTADYTVTAEDLKHRSVTDVATATGKTPTGDPIESKPSDKTIDKKCDCGTGSVIIPIPIPIPLPGTGSLNPGGSVDLPTGSAGTPITTASTPTTPNSSSTPQPTDKPGQPGNGQPGNAQPGQSGSNSAQGARIDSGAGAGETGINTGLLVAGGLSLLAALGTGWVVLARRRRSGN